MSRGVTIEERRGLFEKNKDKVAHTHVYYDPGSDYDMRIIVFWSPEINGWSWIEVPEPFAPELEVNPEYAEKYKELVTKVSAAATKFERMLDELKYICPICGGDLIYPRNNKWIKATLHVWSADIIAWCPRCGITMISETDHFMTRHYYYTREKGTRAGWKLHVMLKRIWRTWRLPPHMSAERCVVDIYEDSEVTKKIVEFVKERLGDGFKYISVER